MKELGHRAWRAAGDLLKGVGRVVVLAGEDRPLARDEQLSRPRRYPGADEALEELHPAPGDRNVGRRAASGACVDVAGSFVVRVVRGRVGPEVESMSSSVPGVRYQLPEQSMAALCIGSMLATSARVCRGSGTAA